MLYPIYWLGGSPCAGKSSVADLLAERYSLAVYRCDDAFYRHTQICNPQDQPSLHAISTMSWDQIWMRPVEVQVATERAAYREEFPIAGVGQLDGSRRTVWA